MTTQNAAGQPSTSLSIEDDLAAHSADLLVFSRYLEGLPARVRIDVKDAEHGADVYAVYLNDAGGFRYKFARFIADEDGFHVKSDAFTLQSTQHFEMSRQHRHTSDFAAVDVSLSHH